MLRTTPTNHGSLRLRQSVTIPALPPLHSDHLLLSLQGPSPAYVKTIPGAVDRCRPARRAHAHSCQRALAVATPAFAHSPSLCERRAPWWTVDSNSWSGQEANAVARGDAEGGCGPLCKQVRRRPGRFAPTFPFTRPPLLSPIPSLVPFLALSRPPPSLAHSHTNWRVAQERAKLMAFVDPGAECHDLDTGTAMDQVKRSD
jgi:hypothetical protein